MPNRGNFWNAQIWGVGNLASDGSIGMVCDAVNFATQSVPNSHVPRGTLANLPGLAMARRIRLLRQTPAGKPESVSQKRRSGTKCRTGASEILGAGARGTESASEALETLAYAESVPTHAPGQIRIAGPSGRHPGAFQEPDGRTEDTGARTANKLTQELTGTIRSRRTQL